MDWSLLRELAPSNSRQVSWWPRENLWKELTNACIQLLTHQIITVFTHPYVNSSLPLELSSILMIFLHQWSLWNRSSSYLNWVVSFYYFDCCNTLIWTQDYHCFTSGIRWYWSKESATCILKWHWFSSCCSLSIYIWKKNYCPLLWPLLGQFSWSWPRSCSYPWLSLN